MLSSHPLFRKSSALKRYDDDFIKKYCGCRALVFEIVTANADQALTKGRKREKKIVNFLLAEKAIIRHVIVQPVLLVNLRITRSQAHVLRWGYVRWHLLVELLTAAFKAGRSNVIIHVLKGKREGGKKKILIKGSQVVK